MDDIHDWAVRIVLSRVNRYRRRLATFIHRTEHSHHVINSEGWKFDLPAMIRQEHEISSRWIFRHTNKLPNSFQRFTRSAKIDSTDG